MTPPLQTRIHMTLWWMYVASMGMFLWTYYEQVIINKRF